MPVETVLTDYHLLEHMGLERNIGNLFLLILAIIIVILIWRAIWFLAGLLVFVFVVYIVYQILKGTL